MIEEPRERTGDGAAVLRIRRAQMSDLAAIVEIECQSFTTPWPVEDLRDELAGVARGTYFVAELQAQGAAAHVIGYIGMWFFVGEAHIGTVAVARQYRERGFGEALLLTLLDYAVRHGGTFATLEYRISNLPAARLYDKYGFTPTRIRKGYYTDTREDAVEVVMRDLGTPEGQLRLRNLRRDWHRRHAEELVVDV
jgi:ribosomal-protein-alanine N-acetyltransferase